MSNIERWLSDAFPTWSWTVSGARDEAAAFGRRDGFEPLHLRIRANTDGTLTVWLDVLDQRYQARGSLKDCQKQLMAQVDRAARASRLYASALRSLRAKVAA